MPRPNSRFRAASESRTAQAQHGFGLGQADADVTLGRSPSGSAGTVYRFTRYSITVAHSN
jgi:hypothetical protein